MCDTYVRVLLSLALQLETYITKNYLLPEAICCNLQMRNVVASEETVFDTCVSNLIFIDNTIII